MPFKFVPFDMTAKREGPRNHFFSVAGSPRGCPVLGRPFLCSGGIVCGRMCSSPLLSSREWPGSSHGKMGSAFPSSPVICTGLEVLGDLGPWFSVLGFMFGLPG